MENSDDRFQKLWKSIPASVWAWFLEAKVPLPIVVNLPTLYLLLVNYEQLIATAGTAGTFLAHLGAFLISTPFVLFNFVFVRWRVPISLIRFARGFYRGLDMALGRFWRDVLAADWGFGHVHGDRGVVEDDGGDDGSDDGYVLVDERDWEGMRRDENRRTGANPNTVTDELTTWGPYIGQTKWALLCTGIVLLLLYLACNYFFDSNGWCGTSGLCGGPDGNGEYTCLSNDEVVRLARHGARATRPWRYRVFVDGSRRMFPDP
ncbi:hypothetical protein F4678DRAFT_479941 [Xylaria arbuscula]|nr:hypothetical protein F4678DRAFT_479941 [Xylaria arbuscula]